MLAGWKNVSTICGHFLSDTDSTANSRIYIGATTSWPNLIIRTQNLPLPGGRVKKVSSLNLVTTLLYDGRAVQIIIRWFREGMFD